MILVSACLAGINCKFNGESNFSSAIIEMVREGKAILICPEQLGGLPTPRKAAEINNSQVITKDGDNVTQQFQRGAEEVLKIAKLYDVKKAILKSRSPSCGKGQIYDGTFSKTLVVGNGVLTALLEKNGIEVISMDND